MFLDLRPDGLYAKRLTKLAFFCELYLILRNFGDILKVFSQAILTRRKFTQQ